MYELMAIHSILWGIIQHYFVIQVVLALATESPFIHPHHSVFERLLTFWPSKIFQAHLVCSLPWS